MDSSLLRRIQIARNAIVGGHQNGHNMGSDYYGNPRHRYRFLTATIPQAVKGGRPFEGYSELPVEYDKSGWMG